LGVFEDFPHGGAGIGEDLRVCVVGVGIGVAHRALEHQQHAHHGSVLSPSHAGWMSPAAGSIGSPQTRHEGSTEEREGSKVSNPALFAPFVLPSSGPLSSSSRHIQPASKAAFSERTPARFLARLSASLLKPALSPALNTDAASASPPLSSRYARSHAAASLRSARSSGDSCAAASRSSAVYATGPSCHSARAHPCSGQSTSR